MPLPEELLLKVAPVVQPVQTDLLSCSLHVLQPATFAAETAHAFVGGVGAFGVIAAMVDATS
jgi:hypothetical protein